MNKTQSSEGIIGSHQAMRRGGCQGPFTTGYYAVSDLDSDSAVVGLDWWIDVINGHDEEYLGFRRLPARIPYSHHHPPRALQRLLFDVPTNSSSALPVAAHAAMCHAPGRRSRAQEPL